MINPDYEFYIALMLIVCGGVGMFGDPDKSTLRKWVYWFVAPLIGAVCSGLAFTSIVAGLGFGGVWLVVFVFAYFRYWL